MSDNDCAHLIPLATHLVAIHRAITHQQDEAISPQLDALMQLVAETLRHVKLQETVWFSARAVLAQAIESLLAEDARCLLTVPDFQHFVSHAFDEVLVTTVVEWGLHSDTEDWLLQSVPEPLKLSEFRDCDAEQGYQYSLHLELGNCHRNLQVPISLPPQRQQGGEHWDCYFQWQQIGKQLEFALFVPGFEPAEQRQLKLELGCLICYVAQLLHMVSRIDQFTYP